MLHPGDQLGCSAWLKCEPGGIRTHRGFFPLKDGEVVPASVLAAAGWPRTGPVLFRDGAITGLDLLPEAERAEVIRKQLAVEFFPLPKDHVFDSLEDPVWDDAHTDTPLKVADARSKPLKKITRPDERLI